MKKQTRLRNKYVREIIKGDYEPGGGVSMTVPDEVLSLREIYNRAVGSGTPMNEREGFYAESEDYDDIDLQKLTNNDLIDRFDTLEQVKIDVEAKRKKLAEDQEALKELKHNSDLELEDIKIELRERKKAAKPDDVATGEDSAKRKG